MARTTDNPTVQVNLRIPEDLIAKVRETLQDPVRNKTKYGSVSELVTTLLYAWTKTNVPLDKI